jgi:hypothetical protein
MPGFDTLLASNQALIRKALRGAIFLGPEDATVITAITSGATADPVALDADYEDAGYITKDDGATWSRDIETSDTMSWGTFEPTRRDITSDVTGLQWTMQETKRLSLELYYGVDLSALVPDATTGEISFVQAVGPNTKYRRALAIMADGVGADAWYIGRFCPRMAITTVAEQQWQDGQETRYGVTGTAFVDPVLGFSVRHFIGGPGAKANAEEMGFA